MQKKWFFAASVLAFALTPELLYSQLHWQKVGTFPNRIATVCFTDENNGFVSTGIVPGGTLPSVKLFRTQDGGKSWKEVFVQFLNSRYGIQDVFMIDKQNGWACGGNSDGHSIWRTNDGGDNWMAVGDKDNGLGTTIRKTAAGIVVADFTKGSVKLSTDDGATFQDVYTTSDDVLGMDFSDDLHGVVNSNFRSGNPMFFTADGGITWSPGSVTTEGWCVYGQKGTSNFFIVPEEYSNTYNLHTKVYRSQDFGKTWDVVFQFPFRMSGAVTGSNSSIYAQTGSILCPDCDYNGQMGIYRSTDQGISWNWLGGPDKGNDARFAIIGSSCNTHVIYAPGDDNVLYKAFDTLGKSPSPTMYNFSSARIINDSFNVTIHLPVYFHHKGVMDDIDMVLHYPTTALQFMGATLYNWKTFDVAGSQSSGRAALHIAAADLNVAPDSLLGYVHFLWKPFEFACDQIDFDSITTGDSPCNDNSDKPFQGIIGSYKTCGLSGVAENEINSMPLDFSIHPNPARTNIQIEIANTSGKFQYELFDELGIEKKRGITSENKFGIDLAGLAEENYYLRLSKANGPAITKRVVVVK
ncbi:MAG: hypothetical protein ACHQM6_00990 [Candidatus Kapaibacterium sp.]